MFAYSPTDGHLGYFQFRAIMNTTTMHILVTSVFVDMFSFLLGKHIGELLGWDVSVYLLL